MNGKLTGGGFPGKSGLILCLTAPVFLVGCAWRVALPEDVRNPAPVVLTDYGRHTRLALPKEGGEMVEYGFGNWNYYALARRGPISSLRAVTGLGPAALARRRLPDIEGEGPSRLWDYGRRSVLFYAEAERVADLREVIELAWRENDVPERYHSRGPLEFVQYDATYHLFRNSNHKTAEWLEALGCRVRGSPILSNFRIDDASGANPYREGLDWVTGVETAESP